MKAIGGLSTAYFIVPTVDDNKLKFVPSLSFSIQKYPSGHPETIQDSTKKNHTVKKRISLTSPIPQSGQFCKEFFQTSQKEIISQILESQSQQGLNPEPLAFYLEKAVAHNMKHYALYSKSSLEREERRPSVATNAPPPIPGDPNRLCKHSGRTPPHPQKQRSLSFASSLAIIASGSDLHSGKRGREPAGKSPAKPLKKLGTEPDSRPGFRQALFSGPRDPDGPQEDVQAAEPDATVVIKDCGMETASCIDLQF